MPDLRPIDFGHLAAQTDGDEALASELLALFSDQCGRHLGTILAAGGGAGPDADERRRAARDAAHTLKGAASAVGAWAVAQAAARVEAELAGRGQADDAVVKALQEAADLARSEIGRRGAA